MLCEIEFTYPDLGDMDYSDNFDRNVIGRFGVDDTDKMYSIGNDEVISNMYNFNSRQFRDGGNVVDEKYKTSICKCLLTNGDDNEVSLKSLDAVVSCGKMSLFTVDINPEMDYDCESDILFWLGESLKLIDDETLDRKVVIKHLPTRDITIIKDGLRYLMTRCKIIKKITGKRGNPYKFILLVEKIMNG
jgi:hypothetical protein